MYPTSSFSAFLEKNDGDFRTLVKSLCESLSFPGESEDIIQDLYYKFLTTEIIDSYRPQFRGKDTKMTTYLYPIIKNYIISKIKSNEFRYYRQSLRNYEPSNDVSEIDFALCHNPINTDYIDVIIHNESTDGQEGLGSDFRTLSRLLRLNKKNKRYLKKRKARDQSFLIELKEELSHLKRVEIDLENDLEYREISDRVSKEVIICDKCGIKYRRERVKCPKCYHNQDVEGCSLTDIFHLMYRGYSGRQIARIYGVSDMSVTNIKYKLAKVLLAYGIRPYRRGKSDGPNKMSAM